jgi:hypothetical protein
MLGKLLIALAATQVFGIEIQGNCNLPEITPIQEFTIQKPLVAVKRVVANDYGVNAGNADNTVQLNQAITQCQGVKGGCMVTLNQGVYMFKTIPVEVKFENLEDFTFDGNNSTLVFNGYPDIAWSRNILIEKVTRGQWINFNFDWDWNTYPLATKVDIISADNNSWTFKFHDISPITTLPNAEFSKDLWTSQQVNKLKSMHIWNEETQSMGALGTIEFFNLGSAATWVNSDAWGGVVTITWPTNYPFSQLPVVCITPLITPLD